MTRAVFGGERFQRMRGVTAGPAGLVAVGSDGTDSAVWRSADGFVWSRVVHDDPSVLGGSGTQGMRARHRRWAGLRGGWIRHIPRGYRRGGLDVC